MSERRSLNRWNLLLLIPVRHADSNEVLGYISDINENGILLLSKKSIELDKQFSLSLCLQDLKQAFIFKGINKECIPFEAKSRWVDKDDNQDFHRTGFQFINISPEARNAISQLVSNVAEI